MAQTRYTLMVQFQYLLYKKQELAPQGILPDGLKPLLKEAARYNITVAEAAGPLPKYMEAHGICPESALVLAATDKTLFELSGMPVATVGYPMAAYPAETLYRADILAEELCAADIVFLERVYQRKHGIPWRVIETNRCYLREMTLSDLPDLYELYQDSGFSEYLEPLHSREEESERTKAYIEHMYRFYGFGMWLVKDRFTDELIGRAGFSITEWQTVPILEMGYAVAPSRQRQGYATELCRSLLRYAKTEELGFREVYCRVRSENQKSVSLLLKLGFTYCGQHMQNGHQIKVYTKTI